MIRWWTAVPLTFGVSGYLYNDNLVMYDHQTNALRSQLLGQAMRGALRPTQPSILPSLLTRWGEWKAARPDTLILSAERVGRVAADIIDPYAGYYASGAAGFSSELALDQRLPSKTWVVGLAGRGRRPRLSPGDDAVGIADQRSVRRLVRFADF